METYPIIKNLPIAQPKRGGGRVASSPLNAKLAIMGIGDAVFIAQSGTDDEKTQMKRAMSRAGSWRRSVDKMHIAFVGVWGEHDGERGIILQRVTDRVPPNPRKRK